MSHPLRGRRYASAADYGGVDDLPSGIGHHGSSSVLYSASRAHPDHVYRWFLHQAPLNPANSYNYHCAHCKKAGGRRAAVPVVVCGGRFVTDPDSPDRPHTCTMPDANGKFEAFTMAHMYAELVMQAIRRRVAQRCVPDMTVQQTYEGVLASLDQHVPPAYVLQVRTMLPEFKAVKCTLARYKRRSNAEAHLHSISALSDGAIVESAGGGATQQPSHSGDDDGAAAPPQPQNEDGGEAQPQTSRADAGKWAMSLSRHGRRYALSTADYGGVDDLPSGIGSIGGSTVLYSASRVHPGHVYRWFLHQAPPKPTGSYSYRCAHCKKAAGRRAAVAVVVRGGRFVSDPDSPAPERPHACTMPDADGNFEAFTMAHMYAELVMQTVKQRVVQRCVPDMSVQQTYEGVLASLDQHVPPAYVLQVRTMLPEFKTVKAMLITTRRRSNAGAHMQCISALSDGAIVESAGGGAPQQRHCAQGGNGGAAACGETPPQDDEAGEAQTSQTCDDGDNASVAGASSAPQQRKRPRFDARKAVQAKKRAVYAPDRHPLLSLSTGSTVDAALRRAMQQAVARHEMRMFALEEKTKEKKLQSAAEHDARVYASKERLADKSTDYDVTIRAQELQRAEDMTKHQRECNALARERMRLENEFIAARTRKVLAEAEQIEAGNMPVKAECHCRHSDGDAEAEYAETEGNGADDGHDANGDV